MKKSILTLLLLGSATVLAQTTPNQVSGDQGRPMDLFAEVPFKALITRIHTLGIDERVYFMEQNGLKQMKRVAAFSASGALAYDHEMAGKGFFDPQSVAGRNAGLEIIPYTISMTEDKRIFISTSAVGFKNMNSELADDHLGYCQGSGYYSYCDSKSGWAVVDNLEILKFEYDKNYNYANMESFKFKAVQIDLKMNLVPSLPETQYLALKAGSAPFGYHKTTVSVLTNDKRTLEGFETSVRYGLEYNLNFENGLRVNAEVMGGNQWSFDHGKEIPLEREAEYQEASAQITDYNNKEDLTGELKNSMRKAVSRSYMFIAPKLEISKKISKENHSPIRIGTSFSTNIPVFDRVHGAYNLDLKKDNNNPVMFNAGIFLNF